MIELLNLLLTVVKNKVNVNSINLIEGNIIKITEKYVVSKKLPVIYIIE